MRLLPTACYLLALASGAHAASREGALTQIAAAKVCHLCCRRYRLHHADSIAVPLKLCAGQLERLAACACKAFDDVDRAFFAPNDASHAPRPHVLHVCK